MSEQKHEFIAGKTCEVCGVSLSVASSCKSCGSYICENCRVDDRGFCLVCTETLCNICNQNLSSRACNICGQLVCEDHGEREGEATICMRCQ